MHALRRSIEEERSAHGDPPVPTQKRIRLGMIAPATNTSLEPVTQAMIAKIPDVTVHFTRIAGKAIGPDAPDEVSFAAFVEAATLLAAAEVDVIAWNGSSASWGKNPAWEQRLCDTIQKETGIVATGTTLAMLDAFALAGIKRYSLAVPFPDYRVQGILKNYAAEGYECIKYDNLDLASVPALKKLPVTRFRDQMRSVADPRSQAIVVLATDVPAVLFADELEAELHVPVLCSIAVTAWKCLEIAGVKPHIAGFGRLMGGKLAG